MYTFKYIYIYICIHSFCFFHRLLLGESQNASMHVYTYICILLFFLVTSCCLESPKRRACMWKDAYSIWSTTSRAPHSSYRLTPIDICTILYIYTYMFVCIHIYTYTHIRARLIPRTASDLTYICTYIYTHIFICIYAYVCVCVCVWLCLCVCAFSTWFTTSRAPHSSYRLRPNIYMYIYIYTYIHIYICICMRVCVCVVVRVCVCVL